MCTFLQCDKESQFHAADSSWAYLTRLLITSTKEKKKKKKEREGFDNVKIYNKFTIFYNEKWRKVIRTVQHDQILVCLVTKFYIFFGIF